MSKEYANQLSFLANGNYQDTNEKGMGISISSSVWNSDGYHVYFYIKIPFLKFFKRWIQVGYIVSPADSNPWYRFYPGFDELKSDAKALFDKAINYANNELAATKKRNDINSTKIKEYNQNLAAQYLKGKE